ncbi:MAG: LysR substrate-binding domain-containing protein [Pseudomonadota bacterium]|nr:LysR substrate-binding domain-containing protein [Pseudomonadota bacterium]
MPISRRALPPLNALRAFEVSGRHLNFRAAAEELGVTQGAVAQQVRLLEDHLGLTLFHRRPRGVVLTGQGMAYLAEVRRAFDLLSEATGQIIARPEAVTISVTPTFASRLLLPNLPALGVALPGVALRTMATETLADFERDQVDIAVRLTRPPFPAGVESHLLFHQRFLAVASPHLVGDSPLPMEAAQLSTMPLLHDTQNNWPAYLGHKGTLPGAMFNQTALALDAALAGQGVALACAPFVEADLAAGRLVVIGKTPFAGGPDYYLLRRRGPSQGAADAVWRWCRDVFTRV